MEFKGFQDDVERMRPALQAVNQGGHELINLERSKQQSVILETLDRVNKNWQTLCVKRLNTSSKYDELREQWERYHSVFRVITVWLDNTEVRLVYMAPVGVDPDVLSTQMKEQKVNSVHYLLTCEGEGGYKPCQCRQILMLILLL